MAKYIVGIEGGDTWECEDQEFNTIHDAVAALEFGQFDDILFDDEDDRNRRAVIALKENGEIVKIIKYSDARKQAQEQP
jgi:hypothetical protein